VKIQAYEGLRIIDFDFPAKWKQNKTNSDYICILIFPEPDHEDY